MDYTVVPIINERTWRWGVKASPLPGELYPPTVGKFRQKAHAQMFARVLNHEADLTRIAPNIAARVEFSPDMKKWIADDMPNDERYT
jgi:hypothetical protein